MSKVTTLAEGHVTAADTLTIELVEALEIPSVILLRWPDSPSVADPIRFEATANAVVALIATAVAYMAMIRQQEF